VVYYKPRRRTSKYVAGAAVVLVAAAGVGAYLFFKDGEYYGKQPSEAMAHTVSRVAGDSTGDQNDQRKADAFALAHAVDEYYTNNTGHYPTQFNANKLSGGAETIAAKLALTYYTVVQFKQGTQPPIEDDSIRVVVGAVCTPSKGATVASTGGRGYVVQYSTRNDFDTFDAKCQET